MAQDIAIRLIGKENAADVQLKNEPFRLFGRMLPCYQDGAWHYTTVLNDTDSWDIFPDEHYDYELMKEDCLFIGAYDGPRCIALAILQAQCHKYMYLYDLKVSSAYRGQHIAGRLIEKACVCARQAGYRGLWTIAQDNNLAACLFYINTGFRIGGLDTEVYKGTSQESKADIYFYKDAE